MCIEDKNHFSTHKLAHNQQTATAVLWSVLCEPHSLFVTIILNNLKFRSIFKYNRIRYACYTCKPASILSQSHSPSPSPSLTHSFIHSLAHSLYRSEPTNIILFYFCVFIILLFFHRLFKWSITDMCCRVNYNGHLKPVEFCYNILTLALTCVCLEF